MIFGIDYRIYHTVLAECFIGCLYIAGDAAEIFFCFRQFSFVQKISDYRKMIVNIMAEFTDLVLVVFQLFIIVFLKLKIFSFQICMKSVRQICGKSYASDIGDQTGNDAWPDIIAFYVPVQDKCS